MVTLSPLTRRLQPGNHQEIDRQTARKGRGSTAGDDEKDMLPDAIEVVVEAGMASTSLLQGGKLGAGPPASWTNGGRRVVGPFEGQAPAGAHQPGRWLEMRQIKIRPVRRPIRRRVLQRAMWPCRIRQRRLV